MRSFPRTRLAPLMFAAASLAPAALHAQQTQASLTGQVLDPQGAAVPGASVIITNTDTAIDRTTQTTSGGRYTVTNLNPGPYKVTVKASGFTEKVLSGIVLQVGQDQGLDVPLSLGSESTVVEVTAAAAVTDTESSAQGTVIDNKEVVELPLNQRTFYSLATLSPAAYLPGQSSTLGFRGGFNVAGNNETANTFTINGVDDNDQNVMAPSFRPSVEAIQEFHLLYGVYSAEYGRTSGGQVVVITKTGSNALHGDLFEFIRNSQFDAKNYFTLPNTGTTFRRNQFGGTLGGPIRKDRTFFFLSYEGLRLAQPFVQNTTVPNPAFLNGDFSSVCTSGFTAGICNTASQQLYVPASTAPGVAGGRVPYLNNQIPTGNFDPIGRYILQQYPTPNPGQSTGLAVQKYTFNEKRIENLDEGSARIDHKFSDKDSLLLQYNYFNDPSFEPSLSLCSQGAIPGSGCTQNQISTLGSINETHIFGPHWLNELRLGFDRLEQPRIGQDDGITTAPKVPGAFSDAHIPANLLGGSPSSSVTGYASVHPYANLPQHRYDDHFNIVDNVSWSHGAHSVKMGVNLFEAHYAYLYVADATGVFSFTGVSGSSKNLTSGSSAADLALGYAATATRSPTAPDIHTRYTALGAFVQDDWKVTPHLTLNLGVRYEDFLPVHDARNVLANWLAPSAANPNGTIEVAGLNGTGTSVFNNDANNFEPRIGLSYQPFGSDRTVFHASYGIFYNSPAIGNGADLSLGLNPPFRLAQSFNSTPVAQSVLSTNPFPVVAGSTPTGTQAQPFTSVAPTGIDPNFRTMYLDEWGLSIDQQLTPTIGLTIGYIGNAGVKIPRVVAANQYINPVPTYTSTVNGVTTTTTTIPAGASPNGVTSTKPISGTSGAVPNPLPTSVQPNAVNYYQWGNIAEYISEGHSSFNALTVKAQKNLGNGISFILAYTWAHAIDNAPGYASTSQSSSGTPQNSLNLQGEKGTSDFNVTSRVALSPVIELPFGANKPFLNQGFASHLLGGFQLSGIYQYDSGRPFTIGSSQNRSGSLYGADRPNVISNPNQGPKTVNQWFNTAAFVVNNWGTFGNESRNAVVGPDLSQLDVAIQRVFAVNERFSVALRFESFNVMNKANFLNPLGTGTGNYQAQTTAQGSLPVTPQTSATNTFGQLTQANDPRSMQFSGKFIF